MSVKRVLVVLIVVATALASFGGVAPAGAAESDVVTTETTFPTWCSGGAGWPQPGPDQTFDVTAPLEAAHGEAFTVRVGPRPSSFPNRIDTVAGVVSMLALRDVTWRYQASSNGVVESASVVPGTGVGFVGTPTTAVEHLDAEGTPLVVPRAAVVVPEVPVDPDSPSGETAYQVPAVDLVVRATGPMGSGVSIRVSGGSGWEPGHLFTSVNSVQTGRARCGASESSSFPSPTGPPAMSRTVISSGPAAVPTTTILQVMPRVVGVGGEVQLVAYVDAPEGTVHFQVDGIEVGHAAIDSEGRALLTTTLDLPGDRSITAHFVGLGGYDPSVSSPRVVHVPIGGPTTTELVIEPSRAVVGEPVILTAQVRSSEGEVVRDGSVSFKRDGRSLGTADVNLNGIARLEATSLPRGEHVVRARYSGSSTGFEPSAAKQAVFVLGGSFSDVDPDHVFADDIDWLERERLAWGYPDGTFRPGGVVTRQAMAAFLYRQAGHPLGSGDVCPGRDFSDVPSDHPFCWDITWLWGLDASAGIELGYPDGTFRPTVPVSRQAAAAFLYRQAGAPDGADPACEAAPFPDVPVAHPFCGEIAWMAGAGLVEGYPDGTFGPEHLVTRQATAAFLHRAAG
jgi:hypothetical protein